VQSGHRRTTATHDSEAWRGTGGTGGNTAAVVLLKVSKTSFCKSSHLYLKDPILGPTRGAAVAVRDVHNCAQCVSAPVRLRWAQWPLNPSRIKSSLGLNPYPPPRLGRASGPARPNRHARPRSAPHALCIHRGHLRCRDPGPGPSTPSSPRGLRTPTRAPEFSRVSPCACPKQGNE